MNCNACDGPIDPGPTVPTETPYCQRCVEKGLAKMLKSLSLEDTLAKLSDEAVAELVFEHVLADIAVTTPRFTLLEEAIKRLKKKGGL